MKMIGSRWLRITSVAALTVVGVTGSIASWRLFDRDPEVSPSINAGRWLSVFGEQR
jgi:hypothetical protein